MREHLALLFTTIIEHNYIPKAVRRFVLTPLDKPGKDPTRSLNKRPIALPSSLMKMLELILARRIPPIVEGELAGNRYAYRRARSTEVFLSDLDHFAPQNRKRGKYTYIVGLDAAGAFDSASLVQLVETLLFFGAPEVATRFLGSWLTRRC